MLNFPANPVDGDVHESWVFDASKGAWVGRFSYAKVGHDHDTRYYTKAEVDTKIGDINTILDNINGEVV